MNRIKKYLLRLSPLSIGVLLWAVGYVFKFYDPLAFSTCDSFNGEYCFVAVGFPLLAYGQWLIASAVIMLFVRLETLKRWRFVAVRYLVARTVVRAFTQVSAGGIGFPERLTVAHLFGIVFLIITVLWVVIHTIILRRRERELRI